ncbi:hypothetical protein CMI46_02805 [Candidatus Pacearchaeota archaeon]|nr:hypothetical protein [Candidatus Pacearchaeota archaeon]|tara:strand:- start:1677 stop:2006 length:330 start_codon:yes stop_codon:yes gene_type:complete
MEQSSFVLIFGESPFVKVLDFFLNYEEFDYSIAQIAKETNTKWETCSKVIDNLVKKKIVKRTRQVGKAWMYMLNRESNLTELLVDIDMKISDFFIKKETDRQRVVKNKI